MLPGLDKILFAQAILIYWAFWAVLQRSKERLRASYQLLGVVYLRCSKPSIYKASWD
jgi:hypothetical protein